LAFIPKNLAPFEVAADECTFQQQRLRDNTDDDPFSRSEVGQEEWAARDNRRFFTTLGKNLGAFCSTRGGSERWPDPVKTQEGRLYSVKTGVTHVGSKQQIFAGKQYLESNSTMAMLRSRVVREIEATRKHKHRDPTCLTQVEILTVTAECKTEKGVIRDGFQIRDITGMRSDLSYLPAHAIPYSEGAFFRSSVDDDVEFWREHFTIPCGRAKARMLLEFGLIHSSANAQNFLIAFNRYVGIGAFVLRDIGDTYWHQDMLKQIWGQHHPGFRGFAEESAQATKHTLHQTSSTDYPAPHMTRLASYSVITHAFAEKMIANRGWTHQAVLEFTQGLFDGFRDYCIEAFADSSTPFAMRAATHRAMSDRDILALGTKMAYPTKPFYNRQDAERVMNKLPAAAAHVRSRSKALLATQGDKLKGIQTILNAEEVLLCAELEMYVQSFTPGKLGKTINLPHVCPASD
jgi:hypothetical protein